MIFTVFYCILLHFNRIFNRNAASGSSKSLCVTFIGKIDFRDGSLRHARSRAGHQNLFKNVYEQHLWYEKKIFLAEASYEEIWRVEVMDFYENVQFLIRRQRPGRQGSATHQKLSHFGQNADVCVAPASRTAPLGPQNLFSHHKCYSIRCLNAF